MKNLVLLLLSILIFLLGIIFRLIQLPGAGILLVIALAIFTAYAGASYIQNKTSVMKYIFLISAIVLLLTLVFAMIKFPYFSEMVIGAVLAGFAIYILTLIFGKKKKETQGEK